VNTRNEYKIRGSKNFLHSLHKPFLGKMERALCVCVWLEGEAQRVVTGVVVRENTI
jgi:hypothetical protein